MNEFQERLQELLTNYEINRVKLSKDIGVSVSTINGYFNCNYFPQIDIAIKIANYFHCSLDFLFGLSDSLNNSDRNNKTFFHNFDKLRQNNKISIAKCMNDLKMSEFNYYRWRDGMFPKTINLIDLAKYFDVSVDYLVGDLLN